MLPIKLYKSDKLKDVAFQIIKSYKIPEKGVIKLTVGWWNIGRRHAPWEMGIVQKITIPIDTWEKEYYVLPEFKMEQDNEWPYLTQEILKNGERF